MPDQDDRRWAEDSDEDVKRPAGQVEPNPLVDIRAVRIAAHANDGAALLAALTDVEIDSALQQIGTALVQVYARTSATDRPRLETVMFSIRNRLAMRRGEGDELLAEDLLAVTNGAESALRGVPVNLDDLDVAMSTGGFDEPGGYLNTETGEVVPAFLTNEEETDDATDVEGPEWIYVESDDSRTQWRDMEAFAETVTDPTLRDHFLRAITGKGAFRRFKDVLHQDADEQTCARWFLERDDAKLGRARELLARHGIRPAP